MTLRKYWEHLFHRTFKRSKADYRRALTEFSRSLTLIVDFEQLLENLAGKLREIADIQEIFIVLRDPDTGQFTLANSRWSLADERTKIFQFTREDRLMRWLTINEIPLIVSESPGVIKYLSQKEKKLLNQFEVQLIIPLLVMNQVTGMVLLSKKRSGEMYTKEELELLTTLLGQSALAFENALLYLEQKQRLRKMFRADRLATIGQIAAGAAHEIRNPLTSIRSTIQYLKKKSRDSDQGEMFSELMIEVDRIDEIIHGLLSFSKPVTPQKERIELSVLIRQVLTLTSSTARRNRVKVKFDPPDDHDTIKADHNQLKQVFLNIILNAIQATPNDGHLTIEIETLQKHGKTQSYRIRFIDTGKGIPDEHMEQIFDPFFTTKKDGTGLGLSICYGIVQQHRGEIEIESSTDPDNSGTTVTVILPCA
jgi:signal transduction histidine kinase